LGVGYTDAQVSATFTSIDSDGNGQIELEEFRAWWQSR
jgi:Ca2+-binding EF-hand superfamily protein